MYSTENENQQSETQDVDAAAPRDENARLTAGLSVWIARAEAAEAEVARLREALEAERAWAISVVMEECWKDREMKLADRIRERLAALRKGGAA